MLAELRDDNERLTSIMRQVHNVCDEYGDVATASLLEVWIDETERRTWFLFEFDPQRPGGERLTGRRRRRPRPLGPHARPSTGDAPSSPNRDPWVYSPRVAMTVMLPVETGRGSSASP